MPLLLILDSLGTSELLLILGVALIFFGPRKLPQISKQIGKSLAEFRKASDDFKSTWAREVALEVEPKPEPPPWPQTNADFDSGTVERGAAMHTNTADVDSQPLIEANPDAQLITPEVTGSPTETTASPGPMRKSDWL